MLKSLYQIALKMLFWENNSYIWEWKQSRDWLYVKDFVEHINCHEKGVLGQTYCRVCSEKTNIETQQLYVKFDKIQPKKNGDLLY